MSNNASWSVDIADTRISPETALPTQLVRQGGAALTRTALQHATCMTETHGVVARPWYLTADSVRRPPWPRTAQVATETDKPARVSRIPTDTVSRSSSILCGAARMPDRMLRVSGESENRVDTRRGHAYDAAYPPQWKSSLRAQHACCQRRPSGMRGRRSCPAKLNRQPSGVHALRRCDRTRSAPQQSSTA